MPGIEVSPNASLDSLPKCEEIIKEHESDFWKVGEALINIKTRQLWKEEFSGKPYKSWEDYLEQAWGYVSKAKQFMEAAKLHSKLIDAGMSEETFKKIVPNETQAKKLARAKGMNKEQAEKFVETIEKEGEKADIGLATKTLGEIRPPKAKPSPSELPAKERQKALVSALEKAKASFDTRIDSLFDEFGEPETIDSWLKAMAEAILARLSK